MQGGPGAGWVGHKAGYGMAGGTYEARRNTLPFDYRDEFPVLEAPDVDVPGPAAEDPVAV